MKKPRNHRREAFLEKIRFTERVCGAIWDVCNNEVRNDEDKARLGHYRRGMMFVINEMRKAA